MNNCAYFAALRHDAVDQLALNPTAAHRWHALVDLFNAHPTLEARASLAAAIRARIDADGVAGFFRATLLEDLERDPVELATAARLLRAIAPYDADRLMAFATYHWGRAVAEEAGHSQLRAHLLGAQAPALMALAGAQLAGACQGSFARRTPTELRKVALVTPFIGDASHPPTGMALRQAEMLVALGLEVKLFSCQEMQQPHMVHYLASKGCLPMAAPKVEELAARLPAGTSASLSDPRLSMMARWRAMLGGVAQFDPDLVMFVGLNSPLMFPLYAARPVLGLGIHAVAPMAPVDVWLTANAALAGRTSAEWGDALPPAFGHHHPFRIKLGPEPAPVSRGELGTEAGQLAMITVGARLTEEISGPWAARMLETLARHPQLVWVLAGGHGELPPALAAANPGQIRTLPFRTDLRSVLRCCDLYVNPPRIGGGFSAAEAMAEALPLLAYADGDAGSKMGDMALADDEAYFDQLEALIASPALRAGSGAAMQALFRATLDLERAGPSLMKACELALERFRAR